ncbi:MAG TPA: hypothetical protein VG675_06050 [Bryobacteraceae bacterium]|nr:hypothetical protein [Bryobacteraceae bacterium]
MRTLGGFGLALLVASSLFGQVRGGGFSARPTLTGTFGNVVFPGGTAALPGVRRSFGNVAFPGGGGPRLQVPFSVRDPTFVSGIGVNKGGFRGGKHFRSGRQQGVITYAYPVFVGGYNGFYDNGYYDNGPADAGFMQGAAPPQQQPNVIVVYPPQQTQAPVVVNGGSDQGQAAVTPDDQGVSIYQAPVREPVTQEPASTTEASHYLIAFKDHTIYLAVAYWVEGDTLHYFTSGSTHNQVSLSLVDRALTERLNREAGIDLRLPQ